MYSWRYEVSNVGTFLWFTGYYITSQWEVSTVNIIQHALMCMLVCVYVASKSGFETLGKYVFPRNDSFGLEFGKADDFPHNEKQVLVRQKLNQP